MLSSCFPFGLCAQTSKERDPGAPTTGLKGTRTPDADEMQPVFLCPRLAEGGFQRGLAQRLPSGVCLLDLQSQLFVPGSFRQQLCLRDHTADVAVSPCLLAASRAGMSCSCRSSLPGHEGLAKCAPRGGRGLTGFLGCAVHRSNSGGPDCSAQQFNGSTLSRAGPVFVVTADSPASFPTLPLALLPVSLHTVNQRDDSDFSRQTPALQRF